jgi:hypothetical protein
MNSNVVVAKQSLHIDFTLIVEKIANSFDY